MYDWSDVAAQLNRSQGQRTANAVQIRWKKLMGKSWDKGILVRKKMVPGKELASATDSRAWAAEIDDDDNDDGIDAGKFHEATGYTRSQVWMLRFLGTGCVTPHEIKEAIELENARHSLTFAFQLELPLGLKKKTVDWLWPSRYVGRTTGRVFPWISSLLSGRWMLCVIDGTP